MANETCDSVARILATSALDGTSTSDTIVVAEKVGQLEAGTVIPSGTSAADILTMILSGSGPVTQVTIYYGAKTNPPTNLDGLTSKQVSSSELIDNYKLRIVAGDEVTKQGQYPIIAIPNSYTLNKWYVEGLPYNIPYLSVASGDYNIYYLEDRSYDVDENPPGIEYTFTISG